MSSTGDIAAVSGAMRAMADEMRVMAQMVNSLQHIWLEGMEDGHKVSIKEKIIAGQSLDYLSQNLEQLSRITAQVPSDCTSSERLVAALGAGLNEITLISAAKRLGWGTAADMPHPHQMGDPELF